MQKEGLYSIVIKAQNGDNCAFEELFTETYNDVYYFALKTVKDENLAADITQETFVTIFNNLNSLNDAVAYSSWSRQITYRHCLQYLKKQNREIVAEENEDGSTIFDDIEEDRAEFIPDENLDKEDFKNTILRIVDKLPEEQRTVVILYYYDELSVKQIAEIQGVSEGTVKSRLNYARKAIKSAVEDYEDKNNIKLHSVGIFPFLFWSFGAEAKACSLSASTVETIASGISSTTGTVMSASSVVQSGSRFLGALWQKIIVGVVASAVVVGGTVAVINVNNKSENSNSPPKSNEIVNENINSQESNVEEDEELVWKGKGKITSGINISSQNEFTIEAEQMRDDSIKGILSVNATTGDSYRRTFEGVGRVEEGNPDLIYYDIELDEEVEKYLSDYPGYTKFALIYSKANETISFSWDSPYDAVLEK